MPCWEAGLGVTRRGRLTDDEAVKYVNTLQNDRKRADYGYGPVPEPYEPAVVDERLAHADRIIEDLRSLL
jgi:hypothetical protein